MKLVKMRCKDENYKILAEKMFGSIQAIINDVTYYPSKKSEVGFEIRRPGEPDIYNLSSARSELDRLEKKGKELKDAIKWVETQLSRYRK